MQERTHPPAPSGHQDDAPGEVIARALERFLGPNTARTAVRTFARQALGLPVEQLRRSDVPQLLEALRPMLNTLLGSGLSRSTLLDLASRFTP